jgi:predicted O-methyltransferase YrrM
LNGKLFQAKSFLTYWLNAVDVHSLHSPFFYNLYTKVIRRTGSDVFAEIEVLRQNLLSSNDTVEVKDLGAGSLHIHNTTRRVSDIARYSLSPKKHSVLYSDLIRYVQAKEVLELGTSLGINTMYLALGNPQASITTLEGSAAIAAIARRQFDMIGLKNINLVEGDIDKTINTVLDSIAVLDVAFIDANHRYDPTLTYFEAIINKTHSRSIIILDDIHYSSDMERAWNVIRAHAKVFATVDLYRCGLVFFDPSLAKQHFVLQF